MTTTVTGLAVMISTLKCDIWIRHIAPPTAALIAADAQIRSAIRRHLSRRPAQIWSVCTWRATDSPKTTADIAMETHTGLSKHHSNPPMATPLPRNGEKSLASCSRRCPAFDAAPATGNMRAAPRTGPIGRFSVAQKNEPRKQKLAGLAAPTTGIEFGSTAYRRKNSVPLGV